MSAAPIALPAQGRTMEVGMRLNSVRHMKRARQFGEGTRVVKAAVEKREHFYGKKIIAGVKAFAPYRTGELAKGGVYRVGDKHGELVLHAFVHRDPGPYPRTYRPDHAQYYVPMAINYGRRDIPSTRANPPLFWNRAIEHANAKGWRGIRDGITAAARAALRKLAKKTGHDIKDL